MHIAAQIFGFLSIIVAIIRFGYIKTRKIYFLISIFGFITIGGSFLLDDKMQGFSMLLAATLSNLSQGFLSSLTSGKRGTIYRFSSSILFGIIGLIIAPPVSLITTIPAIAYTISKFGSGFHNLVTIRKFVFVSTIIWFIYIIIIGNWFVAIGQLFVIIVTIRWFIKVAPSLNEKLSAEFAAEKIK